MLLRSQAGYYRKTVDIDDAKFKIREVDDAVLRAFGDGTSEIVGELKLDDLPDGELTMERIEELTLDRGLRRTVSENFELTIKQRNISDEVCAAGVVSWELGQGEEDPECTPENILELPVDVRVQLANEIVALSTASGVSEAEARF